jgi:hypothetical protein
MTSTIPIKKRGRKRKDTVEDSPLVSVSYVAMSSYTDALEVSEEDTQNILINNPKSEEISEEISEEKQPNIQLVIEEEPILKKRGRKPKGGKLIHKNMIDTVQSSPTSNVILHLKCSLKDIHEYDEKIQIQDPLIYNPSIPPEIMVYDENKGKFSYYNTDPIEPSSTSTDNQFAYVDTLCKKCNVNKVTKKDDICDDCLEENECDASEIDIY